MGFFLFTILLFYSLFDGPLEVCFYAIGPANNKFLTASDTEKV